MRYPATISRAVLGLLFLASIAAALGCAPPLQSGGVEVRAGVAERLGLVCRWRHGGGAGESVCGDVEEAEPESEEPVAESKDHVAAPLAAKPAGER